MQHFYTGEVKDLNDNNPDSSMLYIVTMAFVSMLPIVRRHIVSLFSSHFQVKMFPIILQYSNNI